MAEISTANQDRINAMCPLGYEFSIGGRISLLTTDGYLSSATLTSPTISSGTFADPSITSAHITSLYTRYAPAAASGTTDIAGIDAMTAGCYLIAPLTSAGSSGQCYHLTSAGTSGTFVRIINISTAATGVIGFGATEGVAGMAYIASSTGNFNFTLRANAMIDLFYPSATRVLIVGSTLGAQAFAAAT